MGSRSPFIYHIKHKSMSDTTEQGEDGRGSSTVTPRYISHTLYHRVPALGG